MLKVRNESPGVGRRRTAWLATVALVAGVAIATGSVGVPGISPVPFVAAAPPGQCTGRSIPGGAVGDGTPGNPCTGYGQTITLSSTGGQRFSGTYRVYLIDGSIADITCVNDQAGHPVYDPAVFVNPFTGVQDINAYLSQPQGGVNNILTGLVPAYGIAAALYTVAMEGPQTAFGTAPGNTPVVINGITHTADEWASALWALGHYVVGDRNSGGTVIVPNLGNFSTNPGANQAALDLLAAGQAHPAPWSMTSTLTSDGSYSVTILDANGGPVSGYTPLWNPAASTANLSWAGFPGGAPGLPFLNPSDAAGVSTSALTVTGGGALHSETLGFYNRGTMSLFRASGQFGGGAQFSDQQIMNAAADATQNVYVRFDKVSTDATISVAGGSFEMRDANGVLVDSWVSDGSGTHVSTLPSSVASPLTITEVVAPVGLGIAPPQVVSGPFSSDINNPTISATNPMIDTALIDRLRVRKVVSDQLLAPGGDMSGFVFSIVRDADGFVPSGAPATTNNIGLTPTVPVPAGTYTVCEIAMPEWANASTDNPGCQTLVAGGSAVDVAFDFTNTAITADGATMLSHAVAAPGEQIVQHVWTEGLPVAGRNVNISTVVYKAAAGTPISCAMGEQAFAPIVTNTTLGAAETVTSQTPWTVPAGTATHYTTVTTVSDVATGRVYFTEDCNLPLQSLAVPAIATAAPAVIVRGTVADSYTVTGLPTNAEVTVDATANFDLFVASGFSCANDLNGTLIGNTTVTSVTNGSGTSSAVSGVVAGNVYRFVESLLVSTTRTSTPFGFTVTVPGASGSTITTTSTIPGEGGCAETSPYPNGSTMVHDKVLVGQPAADSLTTTGFGTTNLNSLVYPNGPQAGRPIFSNVVANFTLHAHNPNSVVAARVCDAANQIGATTVPVNGDGLVTATIADYSAAAGMQVSWNEWYEGDRLNVDGSVTEWSTPGTGCTEVAETSIVPALSTQASTPFLNGVEDSTDTIFVVGFGDGSLLTDPTGGVRTVNITGGLHAHKTADFGSWICTTENMLAAIFPIPVTADGTFVSAPITPAVYSAAKGGAVSYHEGFVVTSPTGAIATGPQFGCREPSETSWVPMITTQTWPDRKAGEDNADWAYVTGVPAGTDVSIQLDVYRLVPGNAAGITTATVCAATPPVMSMDYPAVGSGVFGSPPYIIPANEVAGVQYVHQETLSIGGKIVDREICGAVKEITTITRTHKNGRLVKTA